MKPSNLFLARMAVAYRHATRNEYSVDTYWQVRDEWAKSLPFIFPRILKLRKYLVFPAPITLGIARFTAATWMYCIFPIMILGQFLKLVLLISMRSEMKSYRDGDGPARLILAGTSIVNRSFKRLPSETDIPKIVLCTPKLDIQQGADVSVHSFHVQDVLELKEAFTALWISWCIARQVFRERLLRPGIQLQTYTSFEWTTVLIALMKVAPDEVWMSNHYDRWAVLVDFYCQGVLRRTSSGHKIFSRKECKILQHGIEYSDLKLLYKLRRVRKLWFFDRRSAEILLEIAIHRPDAVELEKFPGALHVVNSERSAGVFSLLLILHPIVSDQMHILMKGLSVLPSVCIFLKPHPLHSQKDFKTYEKDNIFFIEDPVYFPRVDCALSYKSTLAVEYEEIGTEVLYVEDLAETKILERIDKKLKARLPSIVNSVHSTNS